MNKAGKCALGCQGSDTVVSVMLYTGSLYAEASLNIPLFTFGHIPLFISGVGGSLAFLLFGL